MATLLAHIYIEELKQHVAQMPENAQTRAEVRRMAIELRDSLKKRGLL